MFRPPMLRSLFAGLALLATADLALAECAPIPLPRPGARRAEIVAAVMPAVVQVLALSAADNTESYAETLGDAMRQAQAGAKQAQGSGFIIAGSGLVMTNEHVIAQSTQIMVKLADGSVRGATLVGRDERTDVALLQIEALARCYPALTWGDSDRIAAGDEVTAVGSPFGLGGSVSAGIISGRGRSVGEGAYHDFLQTDAAINQGNSGGPLLDSAGRVVGINTAILSPAGGNIGIGFSLPAAMARRVAAELVARGRISRIELGLGVQGLTGDSAEALGLASHQGILVMDVQPDSPAERAGILAADAILAVNGRPISGMGAFSAEIATLAPGRPVNLRVWRRGQPMAIEIVPDLKPDAAERARALAATAEPGSLVRFSGLDLAGTTSRLNDVAGQNEAAGGLIVVAVAPHSPGAARGIAVGDIIVGLAGKPLGSTVQLTDAIAEARAAGRRNILVTVLHGKSTAWMALPVNSND